MRGLTQPLRLQITQFKCGLKLAAKKRACGADATGTLKRSAFGTRSDPPFVGDEITLRIRAEAYLQD
jgi:polyisoprenoid-binding protein YceI